ncbi:uncharacterized protein ACIBXB_016689 isoform 1-T2 [Morphnus guianensis]
MPPFPSANRKALEDPGRKLREGWTCSENWYLLFTACLQFNWTSVERVPEAFMGEMANCQANWLFFTEESAVMIYWCVKQLCQVAARLDASSALPSTVRSLIQSQCQPAPRRTRRCPRPSLSATVVAPRDNIFKKGEKKKVAGAQKLQLERGVRTCKRNNPADTKVSEEGGGGDAPGAGAETPLQPLVKTVVRQAVPLQPTEVHGGADIHLQPGEDPTLEQVGARRRL